MSKSVIKSKFEPLSSEVLLDIWNKNDRGSFSDNVFEVISEILTERKLLQNTSANENQEVEIPTLPTNVQESIEQAKPIWFWAIILFIIGIAFIIYAATKTPS